MSNRSPPMRASFWSAWRSRRSTRSKASRPAIAIRQKNTTRNPRSTVATSTEIYDFMRLLWARAGRTFCPVCGRRVQKDTVDQVAQTMLAEPAGNAFLVLFPVKHEAGQIPRSPDRTALARLQPALAERRGLRILHARIAARYRLGRSRSTFSPTASPSRPTCTSASSIPWKPVIANRAKRFSTMRARASAQLFSERFMCKYDNMEFREPEPILFSFNSPAGACPRCQGFGNTIDYSHGSDRPQSRAVARRRRHRAVDQAQRQGVDGRFPHAGARPRALRHAVLRFDGRRAAARAGGRQENRRASGSFSTFSKRRNTSCTCAFF